MLSSRMAIYAATAPIDLRRSFDGLAAAAREQLGHDPKSGALFLFVNKVGDRLKALWWDRTGYCLLCKRLERGRFRIPTLLRPGDTSIALDSRRTAAPARVKRAPAMGLYVASATSFAG
jgi:transposase